MVDKQIKDLAAISGVAGNDLLPFSDTSLADASRKGTVAQLETYLQGNLSAIATQTIVDKEVPAGLLDGINTTFVLANAPIAGTEYVYLNGVLSKSVGEDYTLVGANVIFSIAPLSTDRIVVSYRY